MLDNIKRRFVDWLLGSQKDMKESISVAKSYRYGMQRKQINVKPGRPDDNLVINFTGLLVDRQVSGLFGNIPEFDLPGDEGSQEDIYINQVFNYNKKELLFPKLAEFGAISGTCYVKIIPQADNLPRLIPIDPELVEIQTADDDIDNIIGYVIEYSFNKDGYESTRRQEHVKTENGTWKIIDYISDKSTNWKNKVVNTVEWGYEFPAIVHWQNLPNPYSCYGKPDIDDNVIELQDRINFIASNISKIIRHHAHPTTIGEGVSAPKEHETSPTAFWQIPSGAKVYNLEMDSDLESSFRFYLSLRQTLFDITQNVDTTSMVDKVGALTNFGLKVLWQDYIRRIDIKRRLYGDGILELVRRLLVMNNMNEDPGELIWKDMLPENELETQMALMNDLNMGIVSKQTASTMRGYDWEEELMRMSAEQTSTIDIGSAILKSFQNSTNLNTKPVNPFTLEALGAQTEKQVAE